MKVYDESDMQHSVYDKKLEISRQQLKTRESSKQQWSVRNHNSRMYR